MATKSGKSKQHKKAEQDRSSGSRRNTSLRLDSKTLKTLKMHALETDSSVQAIVEGLINDYLARNGGKSRGAPND